MPVTTLLFLISYIGGCVMALRYPLIGVVTYLMVYFTYPMVAWWAKPVEWMGIRYALVAAIFTIIGMIANMQRVRTGKRFWHIHEVLFVLFVGSVWLSLTTGETPCRDSWVYADKMAKVLVIVIVMTHLVTDFRSYRVLTWTIVAGTFYLGYQSFTAGAHSFMDGRLNDIGGPDFDRAPELGVHFASVLPFLGVMLLADRRRFARGFLIVASILTCNGIVLTRTRSAMTAIIAGFGWVFLKIPRRWRSRAIALGVFGLIGAYSLTDEGFWERMATIPTAIEEQSVEERDRKGQVITAGRIPTWKAAWAMWKANPQGVGVGNFIRLIEHYPPAYFAIDAHNTIVLCLAELGVFGITILMAMIFSTFIRLRRLKRFAQSRPDMQGLVLDILALETAIVTFLVGGMTVSRLYCEWFWWLLAMPVCLDRAVYNALNPIKQRFVMAPVQKKGEFVVPGFGPHLPNAPGPVWSRLRCSTSS